jgi:hypothetical protein
MSTISSTELADFNAAMAEIKKKMAEVRIGMSTSAYTAGHASGDTDLTDLEAKLKHLIELRDDFIGHGVASSPMLREMSDVFKEMEGLGDKAIRHSAIDSDLAERFFRTSANEGVTTEQHRPVVEQAEHAASAAASAAAEAAAKAEEKKKAIAEKHQKYAEKTGELLGSVFEGKAGETAGTMAGGLVGGLVGSAFGPLGKVVGSTVGEVLGGKLGGMADESFSKAQEEALGYSELRRQLGTTVVDFDTLRASTQHLTAGFNVSANDAMQLAKKFVSVTGTLPDNDPSGLGRSLRDAIGYAQGYGISAENTS